MNKCAPTVFLILISLNCILSSNVKWLPNSSFNVAKNFENGKLPCSKQTVIFPESVMNSIEIESNVFVKQLILPRDGELVFGNEQHLQIEFGATDSSNCTQGDVLYLEKSTSSWAEPDVWSSERFNEATPDAERVPCFDDVVIFPAKTQFALVLPEKVQRVRRILLPLEDELKLINNVDMLALYITEQTDEGKQFIESSEDFYGLNINVENVCTSSSGCPCQEQVLEIDCSLKYCAKPLCKDPIQPIGHCCKICGGTIVFDVDQHFIMQSFKYLVDGIVASYGREQLVYHIGRLPNIKVQLVVVDKGDYLGTSPLVINDINHQMGERVYVSQTSSSPLDKSGIGGKIFVSMFFVVVTFMGSIYLYYYKLPEVRFPFNRFAMLTRFHQRTESVVSLTGRDSGVGIGGGTSRASFRNPLYDPKNETVFVEESLLEE